MVSTAKKAYGQTASLDCHLVQALVRRFMKGDELSDALLRDVERHLAVCKDCLAVANGTAKPMSERKELSPALSQFISIVQQPKNLLMVTGLGIVLVVMGTVMRNPTAVLGPKAAIKMAEETKEQPTKTDVVATKSPVPTASSSVQEATPAGKSASAALTALQEADPEPTADELKPADKALPTTQGASPEPQATANEGKPEPPPAKSDIYVVEEKGTAKSKAPAHTKALVTKVKAKTRSGSSRASLPKANASHSENETITAPQKAAKKTKPAVKKTEPSSDPLADVRIFDADGKPVH